MGALCHGPVALLNIELSNGSYLIDGKKITSFSNAEEDSYAKTDVPFMLVTALREVKDGHLNTVLNLLA